MNIDKSGQLMCIVTALVLTTTALAQAQERYVSAAVDKGGILRIVTTSGSVVTPKREPERKSIGKHEGYDDIRISPGGLAVGWLALYPNCCTSYPIPLALVLYTNGRQRSFTGSGLPISEWRFMSDGTEVAFRQETVHGGFGISYELRNVATGKLVAQYQPEYGPDNQVLEVQHEPAWVTAFHSPQQ